MKRLTPIFLLCLAVSPFGLAQTYQVPVVTSTPLVIPQPDGTTIISTTTPSGSIWSCVVPQPNTTYSPTTGALVINGVPVTNLSLSGLSINTPGAPPTPNGNYSVSVLGGAATLSPLPSTAGVTYSVTVPSTSGTSYTVVPGVTVTSGQSVTVTPVFSGAPTTAAWWYYSRPFVVVNSSGAVYVGFANVTSAANPGGQVQVTIK